MLIDFCQTPGRPGTARRRTANTTPQADKAPEAKANLVRGMKGRLEGQGPGRPSPPASPSR